MYQSITSAACRQARTPHIVNGLFLACGACVVLGALLRAPAFVQSYIAPVAPCATAGEG